MAMSDVGFGPVLKGVDLSLAAGELVWLAGPSGGGKSTCLRLMTRLLEPDRGSITFRGRALQDWHPPELRRQAALLAQTPVMLPGSVAHNLRLPFTLRAARGQAPPAEDRLRAGLDDLGLAGVGLEDPAPRLSVGQAQRVALLRLMLMAPRALLLDEPTAPLDPESRGLVEAAVADFAARGGGVVMVSHQEPTAPGVRLRRLVLSGGKVAEA